jgi:hypothetical protein
MTASVWGIAQCSKPVKSEKIRTFLFWWEGTRVSGGAMASILASQVSFSSKGSLSWAEIQPQSKSKKTILKLFVMMISLS